MTGSLRIGVLPTIAPYLVPDFIHHFRKTYPGVSLFIDERANKALIQELEYGNLDIVLTTPPEDFKNLLEIPVYTERFVAYFSEKCDQACRMVSTNSLPAEQMWILKEGHCVQNGSLNFCKNKEIGNHIYEAGSIETLIRIVDRNGGYTIIPELHIGFLTDSQKKNVLPLQTNPPAQRCVSPLIKDDFIRERAVNAVLDTLKAILPAHMWEERASKRPIRLRSTPLNTDKNG